jgi:hypothetical protein
MDDFFYKTDDESMRLCKEARKQILKPTIVKKAFDSRYFNPEEQVNPRAVLQDYKASNSVLSANMVSLVKTFSKLADVTSQIKQEYKSHHAFRDSYARILNERLELALRHKYGDKNYTDTNHSLQSFDALEQSLYARYRLTPEMIDNMSANDLKKVILSKDEELGDNPQTDVISKSEFAAMSYQDILSKLFDVKATSDNPDVERTITITVRDRINK